MTISQDRGQQPEVRSNSGEILAIFVEQREMLQLQVEMQQLREELAKLQGELAALKQAKEAVEAERDGYLKSLHHLLKEDFTFTDEELADFRTKGIPARDVLRELEASLDDS